MTFYTHYCIYCGSKYTYQGSGEGCLRPENDRDYCPRCKTLIINALKDVKPTTKIRYVKVEGEELNRITNLFEGLKTTDNTLSSLSSFDYRPFTESLGEDYYVSCSFYSNYTRYIVLSNTTSQIKIYKVIDIDCDTNEPIGDHIYKIADSKLYFHQRPIKAIKTDNIPINPLEPPTNNIFYYDQTRKSS